MTRKLWFTILGLALIQANPSSTFAQCTGGVWTDVAEMRLTRMGLGAGRVGDLLYTYGGLLPGEPLQPILVADVLDLQTGQTVPIQFAPSARYYPASTVLRGEPYLIGGFFGIYETSNLVWAYDPAADEWNRKANLPARRAGCVGTAYDDQIFVFGGVAANLVAQSNVYAYDPGMNVWTPRTSMPTRRTRMGIAESNGLIYLAGGFDLNGNALAVVERYDASLDEWATLPPMSIPRGNVVAGIINDKLYVMGGENGAVVASTEVYDISSGLWSCRVDMTTPRHSSVAVPSTERIYVLGGSELVGIHSISLVDAFTPPEFVATEKKSFGSFKAKFGSRPSPR